MSKKELVIRTDWLAEETHREIGQFVEEYPNWRQINRSLDDPGAIKFWLGILSDRDLVVGQLSAALEEELERSITVIESRLNLQTTLQPGWWHQDSDQEHGDLRTLVYFPQPEYPPEWGGHLLIDLGDRIESILPQANKAVIFDSRCPHMALDPSRYCWSNRQSVAIKFRLGAARSQIKDQGYFIEQAFNFNL